MTVQAPPNIQRRKALIAYTLGVAGAALAIIVMTRNGLPRPLWIDLSIFVVLAGLAEYWTVPTGAAPFEGEMSPSFTVIFAAAILFGPAFGALAAATGGLLSDALGKRKGLLKCTFNAGQIALVAALSGLAFDALKAGPRLSLTSDAIAFIVAALVYIAVNGVLPTVFLVLCGRRDAHLTLFLREDALFYVAMAPLGVLLACSYQLTRWSLLLFPFVMIVIYKGFKLFASLQTETNNAVVVLADTVDRRDPHTYQHSIRVAQHVANIARQLDLSGREIELIVSAARVHDLGKISTDNRILFKEGPLTEEERAQIKAHPADGAELAGQFSLYRKGCEYIRHHHERWDGKGYPDGLAGEAIPLGARIIAVADSFDAMTSDRPYRDALPREVAIEELKRCSGTQFDAQVVEAFLAPEETSRPEPVPSAELADHVRATECTPSKVPMITIIRRLARLPAGWPLFYGLLAVTGIAWLDTVTGSNVQLVILYLAPVAIVAWCSNSCAFGLVIAVASASVLPIDSLLSHFQPISLLVACWNGAVRLAVFCVVLWLLSRVRTLLGALNELALTDELTGLANLRAFRDIAAREVERCRRYHHQLSLAYIDVDELKSVNDGYGHAEGDRVLRSLAGVLLANMRSVDTIARVGGDEFVVLMPETSAQAAFSLASRALAALPRDVKVAEQGLTCSIGLVTFGRAPGSVAELVGAADELMYDAKAEGRNALRQRIVEARDARLGDRGVAATV